MAKINIQFNNTTYAIDESELTPAIDELQTHLSTVINGSGAVINVGDTDYNIDATKLSTATSDFVAYLGTISGTGSKVIIDGVEYSIDSTKVQSAISEFQTTLDNMGEIEERLEGDGSEYFTLAPTALSFRATAPLDTLQEIQINGQTVDPANYTLTEGSTIVTFPIDYLKTLESGNYEVGVVSEGQSARGEFAVVAPELNEYSFYYNQPYGAYVEMFGSYAAFFLREDGTVDIMDTVSDLPATCTYTIDGGGIVFNTPMGVFTGVITSEGLYCNEMATMFVLGNHLIVADDDYLYMYSEELGGYEVIAIHSTKPKYGAIKTGIYGYDTVALKSHAFYKCRNFTNITIPDTITHIGEYAFVECDNLKRLTIPDSVVSLGIAAVSECYSLTDLIIGNSVPSIYNTLSGVPALTNLVIGNSVKEIYYAQFHNRPLLTNVTLGNSIEHIGDSAFSDCKALESIIFNGTMQQWNSEVIKGSNWNRNVPATYVQCSDGQVAL